MTRRVEKCLTEAEAHRHYESDLEEVGGTRSVDRNRGLRAMRRSLKYYPAGQFDVPDDTVMVWSDLHIGHRNIIRYSGRPFRDLGEMDRTLWARMYEAADPDSTMVIRRRSGHGAGHRGGFTPSMIRSLPCRASHLVIGNHDLHPHGRLRVAGFDHVWTAMVSGGEPPLIWTHYPLKTVPDGYVNVHGHLHNREPPAKTSHINVAVEQLEYRPVRLSELRALARELVAGTYPAGKTTLERLDSLRQALGETQG